MNGTAPTNGNSAYPNTRYASVFETDTLQKKKQPGKCIIHYLSIRNPFIINLLAYHHPYHTLIRYF